jgi:hypothetical protein
MVLFGFMIKLGMIKHYEAMPDRMINEFKAAWIDFDITLKDLSKELGISLANKFHGWWHFFEYLAYHRLTQCYKDEQRGEAFNRRYRTFFPILKSNWSEYKLMLMSNNIVHKSILQNAVDKTNQNTTEYLSFLMETDYIQRTKSNDYYQKYSR